MTNFALAFVFKLQSNAHCSISDMFSLLHVLYDVVLATGRENNSPSVRLKPITLVNKYFFPRGKMSVSDVFLGAEFKCFQNFSTTRTFRSRLKDWNILLQDTKVCFYHGRHEEFKYFFSLEDDDVFCNDVFSVMGVLGHEYNPDS
jgi:hypothetical protein